MPPTSDDLFRSAAAKIQEAKALQAAADTEKRELTAEEETKFNDLLAQAEKDKKEGERRRKLEAATAAIEAPPARLTEPDQPTDRPPPAEPRDRAAEARGGFVHMGEFAMAVQRAMRPGAVVDNRLQIGASATGMRQALGGDGGFLVPPAFSTAIWDGLNAGTQNLLGMCDQYTVEGESLTFNANAETSRVAGSRYGGILGYWIAEADQITASKPTFRQVKIEPQQLAVLVYCTEKLLRNSSQGLQQYLTKAATDEINFLVGNSLIRGTGVGQPLGVLNAACTVSVAKETSQAAATILEANLSKMRARLHPRSWGNAVWFVNVDVYPQLDLLYSVVKNVAGAENVGGGSSSMFNRDANTILGRPIIPIEYCSTLGTVGDIILADMKGMIAGVRGGVESAMSMHLRFDYAESVFRFMFEADARPWLLAAQTPANGSNTLSTFVTLATRS